MQERLIYFDCNATTPIAKPVLDAMLPFLIDRFANPSSMHQFGDKINESVMKARLEVANIISAEPDEIIFTSGATESINIALKGVAQDVAYKGKHIITVSTEHPAVLNTCMYLETCGYEVTYLPVNHEGLINLGELESFLRPDTIIVCVMFVNNETGVIQPIREIASLAHKKGALFMTDATQAIGKIDIDVDKLGIDLLCMSGHKMYAPKGIGALYFRQQVNLFKLPPFTHGGGQEHGIRSGTLNVPGIVALGKACEIAESEMAADAARIKRMRNQLEYELLKIPGTFVNGSIDNRLYNICSLTFPDADANVFIGKMRNIAVSNGSACKAAVMEPSHVLRAMGLSEDEAFGTIRFSLGKFNTMLEVEYVVNAIKTLLHSKNKNA